MRFLVTCSPLFLTALLGAQDTTPKPTSKPSEDDAALIYAEVRKLLDPGEDFDLTLLEEAAESLRDNDPLPERLRPYLELRRDALAKFDAASKLPRCDWQVNPDTLFLRAMEPSDGLIATDETLELDLILAVRNREHDRVVQRASAMLRYAHHFDATIGYLGPEFGQNMDRLTAEWLGHWVDHAEPSAQQRARTARAVRTRRGNIPSMVDWLTLSEKRCRESVRIHAKELRLNDTVREQLDKAFRQELDTLLAPARRFTMSEEPKDLEEYDRLLEELGDACRDAKGRFRKPEAVKDVPRELARLLLALLAPNMKGYHDNHRDNVARLDALLEKLEAK